MFSPSLNSAPFSSVRSSRRRQRPLSNDGSIPQPKAKRQRSALNEQTFVPPDGVPEMEETKSLKKATPTMRESSREIPGQRREIAVRGKKPKSGDRAIKGDGSVVLTTNDTYTVSKLPALPDRLRADVTGRQHGAIYSDSGYALTLTHSHAIVWPYAINIPSPETFTFALPYPSKHISEPLPLGSLVSSSASSSEPGLVVVIPTSGKITYWESIASAATLDLICQQRNGVELSIPGMLSGETVIQILNAESAGFGLAFSTGRIAYMSVRDGQGRPAISVQFLRGSSGPVSSGIFGSLRNALSSSAWRGDIAAVRAGRPEKVGERNVVVATARGKLQSWSMHRGGHNSLQAEAEGREAIVMAIKQADPLLSDLLLESFEIIDFTYTPKSVGHTQLSSQDDGIHLLLLTSLTDRQISHYSLVDVVIKENELVIGNVRPIKSYTTPINRMATSKTRLYLPNPALVAYVVFDKAVIILSMAKQPDSPDSQLRTESHILPQSFEDVIDFREDMSVEIVGSGMEEPQVQPSHGIEETKSRRFKAKYPATVLIVRGGGILRVAATNVTKLVSNTARQVTAKSKLEQAVFFGTLERNPLSFTVRPELQFPADEVGAAALELSLEILRSRTPYVPAVPASIVENLRKRSSALRDLVEHLKVMAVDLDRITRWKLLWNAEKMEAATLIWKSYDAGLKRKAQGEKRGLLTDLVEFIHEDYKSQPVAEAGELDRVRHWFINDIWNLEVAVPWAYQVIKYTYQDGQKDHGYVMQILSEADELVMNALEGAFNFRSANLELYGLQHEQLENGILKTGYEGLPEVWTSNIFIVENLRKQVELSGMLVKEYWGKPSSQNLDPGVVDKIRHELPRLVDLAIRSSTERIRWDSAQRSPELQIEAENIARLQKNSQDKQITMLAADLDLGDEAIDIAEKHQIMPTLASVIMLEMNDCAIRVRGSGLEREEFEFWGSRAIDLQVRIKRLFAKFGASWATALYEHYIEIGSIANLLDQNQDEQEFLTVFLRSKPEYAKIAWLHEVTRQKNFDQPGKTLLDLGLKRERDLWSKKVELSIGKLARLAGQDSSHANVILIPDRGETELIATNDQLGLIKIQNQVYDYVLPSIDAAIDDNAELQLALENHRSKSLKKKMALSLLLEQGMGHLVRHEAMDSLSLIDLLTLMVDNGVSEEDHSFRAQQFYLAVEASRHGLGNKAQQSLTQRIIWRRCMLRDTWTEVNDTDMKDDQQVLDQLRTTALYMTFRACIKNGLFEKNSGVKTISPEDVLGAGIGELEPRFSGLDASIQGSILKDMQAEDDALRLYIEKCRLDIWYQAALDLAKRDAVEKLNEETEDEMNMELAAEKLREVEEGIKENERRKAEGLLHSKPRYKSKARLDRSLSKLKGSIQY